MVGKETDEFSLEYVECAIPQEYQINVYRIAIHEAKFSWRKRILEEGKEPIPVFLPGESHGQGILASYSP